MNSERGLALFNTSESGGAAVDFTGFRIDPRHFLSEDA